MKEYKLDKSTFIGGWYIPDSICNEVIDVFNNNKVNRDNYFMT